MNVSWNKDIKDLIKLSSSSSFFRSHHSALGLDKEEDWLENIMDKYHLDSVASPFGQDNINIEPVSNQAIERLRSCFSKGDMLNSAKNLEESFTDPDRIKFNVVVHYPVQFECLRAALGYKRKEFQKALTSSHRWFSSGGQTNTDFYKSDNGKYIAKCISPLEFENFQANALFYFKYIFSTISTNKDTFLSKILALVEIKYGKEDKKYLVIMEGITYGMNASDHTKTYDLKGSKMNRFLKTNIKNKTNLDTNFLLERNGDPLVLQMPPEMDFFAILERDVGFLKEQNIVDYSFLIVINKQDRVVKVGIIDYLRKYDFRKAIENKFKKMRNFGQDPTIVEPDRYGERFLESMHRYLVIKSHVSLTDK